MDLTPGASFFSISEAQCSNSFDLSAFPFPHVDRMSTSFLTGSAYLWMLAEGRPEPPTTRDVVLGRVMLAGLFGVVRGVIQVAFGDMGMVAGFSCLPDS